MENLALVALVESLKAAMADAVVRRVIQHHPNGFIFQTRAAKTPAFKIVAEPQNPVMYLSESRPPIESTGADFLMVLRKHLTSAELTGFHKPLSERIVELVFKTAVPTRELETMSLVIELIPNAPNIILLDSERRVLSSFIDITPQHGIGQYETYAFPKAGDKIELERVLLENVPELADPEPPAEPSWLISRVAGIGPIFAGEIVHRRKKSRKPLAEEIRSIVEQAQAPSKAAWIYTDLPLGHILERNDVQRLSKAILSPVELESLGRTHSSRLFPNILEASRFLFEELEMRMLLEQAKTPVLRDLRAAGKRMGDREKKVLREQTKYKEAEGLQKTAQMLTSSGLKMDQHYESVQVTDYFEDRPKPVSVPLDGTVSLRENIEKMFKRHHKAARGRGMVVQQLAQLRNKQILLEEHIRRLQAIRDWDTWLAIASRIEPPGRSAGSGAPEVSAPPESEGRGRIRSLKIGNKEILIGRSSRENDRLTFDLAAPDDFWFHVADYSGSHVVVKNPLKEKELDEDVLLKAAQLAAYFSQARNSSKVEVHYTKRKQVSKPRKAKPGLVRLQEFRSITVEPRNWLE